MAVDAQGDRDRGVAETFLNDTRMDALLQRESRPGVAEAVQRETFEAVPVDSAQELRAHRIRTKACSVGLVKHQSLIGEVRANKQAFFEHRLAVIAEHRDGRIIEGDRPPATLRLRFADGHLAARLRDGLDYTQTPVVEVDVLPAESDRFTATHAGRRKEHPESVKAIATLA